MQPRILSGLTYTENNGISTNNFTRGSLSGYTPDGLPFQLAFKCPASEKTKWQLLFNNTLSPMLRNASTRMAAAFEQFENLHDSNRADHVAPRKACIHNMIDDIQGAVKALELSELSLTVGFSHQYKDQISFAGFSCGATGIAIDSNNITQITDHYEQPATHFSHTLSDDEFKEMKSRCQVFSYAVNAGDTFLAFVDAPLAMLDHGRISINHDEKTQQRVIKTPRHFNGRLAGESLRDFFQGIAPKNKPVVNSQISMPTAEQALAESQRIHDAATLELNNLIAALPGNDPRVAIVSEIMKQSTKLLQNPNELANVTNTYVTITNVLKDNTADNIEHLRQQALRMDRMSSTIHKAISIALFALALVSLTIAMALAMSGIAIIALPILAPIAMLAIYGGLANALVDPLNVSHKSTARFFGLTKQLTHLANEQDKLNPSPRVS